MAPDTIYRSFDGLNWYKFEEAEKWEERLTAVKRSLEDLGGYRGLCELTQRTAHRKGGFLALYVTTLDEVRLAESLEEIAALGRWSQKILDEVGDCPVHPTMEGGTLPYMD